MPEKKECGSFLYMCEQVETREFYQGIKIVCADSLPEARMFRKKHDDATTLTNEGLKIRKLGDAGKNILKGVICSEVDKRSSYIGVR